MKKSVLFALLSVIFISNQALAASHNNPFSLPSTLPLEAPPFDKIKESDYLPAFEQAMQQQVQEINAIVSNLAQPTFENTIVAMEKSGRMLDRVSNVFDAIVQANTNPNLDHIQTIITPKLAAHHDNIYLNPALFARVKSIYDERANLHLDPESAQLLKIYYQMFVHEGANLAATNKIKLKEINKKIAELETAFQQKLLAANKKGELTINNIADLSGLSKTEIDALTVKDKYVIPLQNTTQQPLLQSLSNRNIRQQLFAHSWNRAEQNDANDTRNLIATLAKLRAEKAALFAYPNYAAYTLYDQMANTPELVHHFLDQLKPHAQTKITEDAIKIQNIINEKNHFDLKAWDWNYYADELRKRKFQFNDEELKPYFELNNVLQNGVFYAANQLYGLTFKERHDLPVYHPDVRVFTVYDNDGSVLGLLYLDYFKRDNKTGGAWMNSFVDQSTLLNTKPVVYNVANFTKPAKGEPALLTSDDVVTMFHEFGHALHALFFKNKYPLINSDIARDYVEFPSQFNEHWAFYPDVLNHYAKHYKTGKPLPDEMAQKIPSARKFDKPYSVGEILAAAELDMKWHEISASESKQNVDAFELQALSESHTNFQNVPTRYRSSYFMHIWANGYAAAYYAYLWSEMLDDDVYAWFLDHGGMTRANGQRYRDLILSRGHADDYGIMFKQFYGKDPDIQPMLNNLGL